MSGFELNKLIGAVLLAAIIAMVVGFASDALYRPNLDPKQRGYMVAVSEVSAAEDSSSAVEEKIDINALLATADVGRGEKIFKKCIACHTVEKGGAHKIGPNLYAIVGKDKGRKDDGYAYSPAMAAAPGVWDHESLAAFLHSPKKYVPGTKMSFVGLKSGQDIADVIKYLEQYK